MLANNVEKWLNDLIFPVARNTYNYRFRQFFKDNTFGDRFEGEIVFLLPQEIMKSAREIIESMERIADKMGMKILFSHYGFSGFHTLEGLKKLVEIPAKSPQSIKLLIVPPKLSKHELENLQ